MPGGRSRLRRRPRAPTASIERTGPRALAAGADRAATVLACRRAPPPEVSTAVATMNSEPRCQRRAAWCASGAACAALAPGAAPAVCMPVGPPREALVRAQVEGELELRARQAAARRAARRRAMRSSSCSGRPASPASAASSAASSRIVSGFGSGSLRSLMACLSQLVDARGARACRRWSRSCPITAASSAFESPAKNFSATSSRSRGCSDSSAGTHRCPAQRRSLPRRSMARRPRRTRLSIERCGAAAAPQLVQRRVARDAEQPCPRRAAARAGSSRGGDRRARRRAR